MAAVGCSILNTLTRLSMTCEGTLPPEWTGLSQLRTLYLSINNIFGMLPIEWGQQGAFTRLYDLRLDANQLTGERARTGPETLAFARPRES